jgi:non-ribosomal peptide synthetase component F
MFVLAALGTLLYRVTGQDDVLIGSPVANRGSVELESLIGFVSNTLVFRTRMEGNPTFRELLGRVREMTLDVYANQEVPFEKIVQAVGPDREPGVNPLFQVNLRVSGSSRRSLRIAGLETTRLRIDSGLARFDLALDIELLESAIQGYVRYNRDLFEPATIGRLADDFVDLLRDALADPDRRLLSFGLSGWRDGSGTGTQLSAAAGPRGYRGRART